MNIIEKELKDELEGRKSPFFFVCDQILDKSLEIKYNIIIDEEIIEDKTYVYKITKK